MKIVNLGNSIYTNYLCVLDGHAVLIDFGNNIHYADAVKKMEKAGVKPQDIDYAILTHVHADHVSYLREFMNNNPTTLVCHKKAAESLLVGHDQSFYYSSKFNRKLSELTAKMNGGPASWKPVDINPMKHICVDGDYRIDEIGATVFTLSGHTTDSIGILFDDGNCFVGDAVMNSVPAKKLIPLLIQDGQAFKESYKKLIAKDAKAYYPGHGAPFTKEKLEKYLPVAEALQTF